MPTDTPSRPSTALFVADRERSCADSFIVQVRVGAFAIILDGQMPSSLITRNAPEARVRVSHYQLGVGHLAMAHGPPVPAVQVAQQLSTS